MKLYKVISQIVFLIIAYSSLSAQRDIPQVDFPRVDSSNCQCPVPPNPTVLKKGYAFISRANGLFYMENLKTYIQDSVIITGSDSVTFEEDTVCIINMGMEYCVSIDSVYIQDSSFCYIVLADTTCIPWSNAGINLYISDGSLTGNRTLTQNSHWLNFGPGLLYLNSASTRVGIGTTSPSAPFKLSVAGPIYSNQGTSNTFISGGNSTLSGSGNTAVGSDVAQFMTTAFANSLYGLQSGQFITTGLRNTATGYTSLHSLTTGSDNVAIGYRSLYSAISTDNNIAIGAAAGENNTGADNVFIGYRSGRNITGSGNILLGSQSGLSLTALSNQLRIDNSDNASSLISADFNMDTMRINGSLMIRNALKDKDGDAGTSGYILSTTGTGIDWVSTSSAVTIPINNLRDATGTNTINNAAYLQEWDWNGLTSGSGLKLASTNTGATGSTQKLVEISLTGANGTSGQATSALYVTNAHSGTSNTNYALNASVSNAGAGSAAILGTGSGSAVRGVQGVAAGGSGAAGVFGSNSVSGGYALDGQTSGGAVPQRLLNNNTSTNTVLDMLQLRRDVSGGSGANGEGGAIKFSLQTSTTQNVESNKISSVWIDALHPSQTSKLVFSGNFNATTIDILTLGGIFSNNPGDIQFNQYPNTRSDENSSNFLGTDAAGGLLTNDKAEFFPTALSAGVTQTLLPSPGYLVNTSGTPTWSLPNPVTSTGVSYWIKNRGSGNMTVNVSGGGSTIYSTSAVSSLTIFPGEAYELHSDGTYWDVY